MKKEDLQALGVAEDICDKIIAIAEKENERLISENKRLTGELETEKNDRGKEVGELKKLISDNEKNRTTEKDGLLKELNALKYDNAAREVLSKASINSELAKKAVLSILKEKAPELDENGAIPGVDKILEEIKKSNPDAFGTDKPEPKIITGGAAGGGEVTKEEFDKMGYKERLEFFRSNPEEYQSLAGKDKE